MVYSCLFQWFTTNPSNLFQETPHWFVVEPHPGPGEDPGRLWRQIWDAGHRCGDSWGNQRFRLGHLYGHYISLYGLSMDNMRRISGHG